MATITPYPREYVFSDFYDAPYQAQFSDLGLDTFHAKEFFLGHLRMDVLTNGGVVVTDANALDGRMFSLFSPRELIQEIMPFDGATPLVIRTRRPSLEESLTKFIQPKDDNTLAPFLFSSLGSNAAPVAAALRQEKTSSRPIMSVDDICELFATLGLNSEPINKITNHWRQWCSRKNIDGVIIDQWKTDQKYDKSLMDSIIDESLGIIHQDILRSDLSMSELDELSMISNCFSKGKDKNNNHANRSALHELAEYYKSDRIFSYVTRMRAAYDSGYNAALASQHGCRFFGRYYSKDVSQERGENIYVNDAEQNILTYLGELTPSRFRNLYSAVIEEYNKQHEKSRTRIAIEIISGEACKRTKGLSVSNVLTTSVGAASSAIDFISELSAVKGASLFFTLAAPMLSSKIQQRVLRLQIQKVIREFEGK